MSKNIEHRIKNAEFRRIFSESWAACARTPWPPPAKKATSDMKSADSPPIDNHKEQSRMVLVGPK